MTRLGTRLAGGPGSSPRCGRAFLMVFFHHGNHRHSSSFDMGMDHPFEAWDHSEDNYIGLTHGLFIVEYLFGV